MPPIRERNTIKCENNADCFFTYHGVVNYEFAPLGKTINQVYYLEVIGCMRDMV
jgi:hypothetical protein